MIFFKKKLFWNTSKLIINFQHLVKLVSLNHAHTVREFEVPNQLDSNCLVNLGPRFIVSKLLIKHKRH